MRQALYVIEAWDRDCERSDYWRDIEDTIIALRQALEQPADEPVAYMSRNSHGGYSFCLSPQFFDNPEPLYTRPQPSAWVELTDEEIDLLINGRGDEDDDDYVEPTGDGLGVTDADLKTLVHRADAMLREKNGGMK
jgi:hypothetical protein